MKLWPMTIILHVLCGPPGSIRAEAVYEVAEGGTITVQCHFFFNGNRKIFCKNYCDKEEDILVKTSENGRCKGRYCIEYKYQGLFNSDIMKVNITNVTSTDSGRYQCFVERFIINGNHYFWIKVTKNASLNPTFILKAEPDVTLKPTADLRTLQRGDAASVTTTQPSLTPPVVKADPTFLMVLVPTLILVVIIPSCVLAFYIKRKSQNDFEVTRQSEVVMNENRNAPASEPADSPSQTLSADTRDHNHI